MALFDAFKNMFGKKTPEPSALETQAVEGTPAPEPTSVTAPGMENTPDTSSLDAPEAGVAHQGEASAAAPELSAPEALDAGMPDTPADELGATPTTLPEESASDPIVPLYLTDDPAGETPIDPDAVLETPLAAPAADEPQAPTLEPSLSAYAAFPTEPDLSLDTADALDNLVAPTLNTPPDTDTESQADLIAQGAEDSIPGNGGEPAVESTGDALTEELAEASGEGTTEESLEFDFVSKTTTDETPAVAFEPETENINRLVDSTLEPEPSNATPEDQVEPQAEETASPEEPFAGSTEVPEATLEDEDSEIEAAPEETVDLEPPVVSVVMPPVERPKVKKTIAKITPMSELIAPPPPPPPVSKGRPKMEAKEKSPVPVPEKSKSARTPKAEPAPIPAPAAKPKSTKPTKPESPKPVRSPESKPEPVIPVASQRPTEPVRPVTRARHASWGWLVGLIVGVLVGSLLGVGWFIIGPGKQKLLAAQAKAEGQIKALKTELDNERMAQMNVRTGQKRLFELLNDFHKDWNRIPGKPNYFKPAGGKSVVVYWTDGLVWRQYYVYQGKGADGPMSRLNAEPDKNTAVLIKNLSRGINRFAVSAINKEGKETPKSEEVIIRWP